MSSNIAITRDLTNNYRRFYRNRNIIVTIMNLMNVATVPLSPHESCSNNPIGGFGFPLCRGENEGKRWRKWAPPPARSTSATHKKRFVCWVEQKKNTTRNATPRTPETHV